MAIPIEEIKEGAVVRWLRGHHPGSLSEIVQVNPNTVYLRNLVTTPASTTFGSGSDKGKRWAVGKFRVQVQCELHQAAPDPDARRQAVAAAQQEAERAIAAVEARLVSAPTLTIERPVEAVPSYSLRDKLRVSFEQHCDGDRDRFLSLWRDSNTTWLELAQLLELTVPEVSELAGALEIDERRAVYVPPVQEQEQPMPQFRAADRNGVVRRKRRSSERVLAELERRGGKRYVDDLNQWYGVMGAAQALDCSWNTYFEVCKTLGAAPLTRGHRPKGAPNGITVERLPDYTYENPSGQSGGRSAAKAIMPRALYKEAPLVAATNGHGSTSNGGTPKVTEGELRPGATVGAWKERMAQDRARLKVREDELREELAAIVSERETIDRILEQVRVIAR